MSRVTVALIVAIVALVASIAANAVAFTRSPGLRDGSVQVADLSPELLATNFRGQQGPRGERGKPGVRGKKGLRGDQGLSGLPGAPGADYGVEVEDLDTRVSDLEFNMDEICGTAVVTGYAYGNSLARVFLC